MLQIESASLSDQGRKRHNNEDFIAAFEPEDPEELSASGCLYLVADGVGGAIKGEKASRYAVQKVLFEYYRHPELSIEERLRESMHQAGNDIYVYAQENHESRMATTMVAASVKADKLTIANVGDSRAYLIRGGEIQQITHDHNLVGEMVRDGLLSEEESHRSRVKNLLTRSLGGELDVNIDIFPYIPLQAGDRFLLCTDGLSRYASQSDLLSLASKGTPQEVVDGLIAYANQKGGIDNISAILVSVGQGIEGQEPILRKKAGQSTADWENIPTLVEAVKPVQKMKWISNRRYLAWGILGIALMFVLGSILVWVPKITSTVFPFVSATPTENFISQKVGTKINSTQAITSTQAVAVITDRELQAETAILMTGTITVTTPVEGIATGTAIPPTCIYKTNSVENSISTIYEKFGLNYLEFQQFHYYECSGEITYDNCKPRLLLKNPELIFKIYWIEIPVTLEACTEHGGILIQQP